jgi:hypothetical protein
MSATHRRYGPAFWVACVIGWSVIVFGVAGLLDRLGARGTIDVGVWVVGGNLVHDAIIAPLGLLLALAVALVVHRPWRAPLAAGVVTSAIVVAVAYPALRGFGRKPRNPSVLPLDYDRAVLTVLAVVWGLVALWCGVLVVRRLRTRYADGSGVGSGSTPMARRLSGDHPASSP